MLVEDKELCQLNKDRHNLMRDLNNKVISKTVYENRMGPMRVRIRELVDMLIEGEHKKDKLEEVHKMSEQTEEVKKVGRKVKPDTYASVIAKVLMLKGIKNLGDAVKKVNELKPGRDEKKNITQIKTIIREVKAGKGRWVAYNWDAEAFLLIPKE